MSAAIQEKETVYFKLLSTRAFVPFPRLGSFGLNLRSPERELIPAGESAVIADIKLKIIPPANTYTCVVPRADLSSRYNVELGAGQIYTLFNENSLKIQLYNRGRESFVVHRGTVVAGLIFQKIVKPAKLLRFSSAIVTVNDDNAIDYKIKLDETTKLTDVSEIVNPFYSSHHILKIFLCFRTTKKLCCFFLQTKIKLQFEKQNWTSEMFKKPLPELEK